MKTLRPWENSNGTLKTTEELKEVSKQWDANTWEEFLKTVEVRKSSYEITFSNLIERLNDENVLSDYISSSSLENQPFLQELFCRNISKREREILELYYIEGLSQRDIARKLNISRRAARSYQERALDKIKKALDSKIEVLPVYAEPKNVSDSKAV